MAGLSSDERTAAFAFDGAAPAGTARPAGPAGRGCLLLHGFTGTPAEMRPLGTRLAARGFTVRAPLLPGHGTRVDDLARTTWRDWFAAALESWDELGERSAARAVVGLSMGALLALHLAHERGREVAAVAALAPAIRLRDQRSAETTLWIRRLPRLPRRFEIVPKRRRDPEAERLTPAYDEIPLRSLASMIELQRVVRAEIEAALGSRTKRRISFARSGHIMTEDADAPDVLAAVESFLSDHLGS
jgi:carboxylesterase